ncbi:MAG: glycosyltransferase family 39 protein [Candidatus Omnitrophica bacterium]|nr:glycosyltransferase family 39 protein [Candidatus Omnitrophota bacterium]
MSKKNKFLLLIAAYFLIHLLVRIFISDSVEFDEAEQVLFSQNLSLGYGSQPPLYEWLQKVFFTVFGLNIFSLALLKNSLFVLIYFFLYQSAKLIIKQDKYAVLASLALFLTYTYGWQSMHQLTHAILALAVCSITFFVFLKVIQTQKLKYYLVLGLTAGLGILAKYNYLIFILALLIAALTIQEFRKAVFNKRMVLVLIIVLLISSPHFIWFGSHLKLATQRLVQIQADTNKAKGLLDFLLCLLAILGPFLLVFLIFFPKAFSRNRSLDASDTQFKKLLERFFIAAILITAIWVVVFKIVDFEERWLQLIFFTVPLYLFLRLKGKTISGVKLKIYSWLVVIFALALPVMMVACALAPDTFGYKRLHYPIAELAKQIRSEGFDQGLVLSCDTSVAADIKLQFKDSLVLTHRMPLQPKPRLDKILLIWGDTWWYDVPKELAEILPHYGIKASRTETVKQALYKHSEKEYYKVYLMVVNR